MQEEIYKIKKEILQKIVPSEHCQITIESLAKKLEQKTIVACKEQGIDAVVRVEGSVAKGTWLSEEPDIDVFLRLPVTIPRRFLGEISLKIARGVTEGSEQIERFAEHPYLESIIEDTRVNIVPCYDVKLGKWLSATDRTPFHTDYIRKYLNKKLQDEVRLLKQFMKGIKCYGAEIRTGGFSGYLCELLILNFKSFSETITAFSEYETRVVVDIEDYYAKCSKELQQVFTEPLVVVDPVDKLRNVASAVQEQKLYEFIGAARAFIRTPNRQFFFPPNQSLSTEILKKNIKERGSCIVSVTFDRVEAVPDILWGQLYKAKRALRRMISRDGFKVFRDDVWSNGEGENTIIFELENCARPSVKKHLGPPLEKRKECEKFLTKYLNNNLVVSGPYIEEGRWVVEIHWNISGISQLLSEKLKEGGRKNGIPEQISQAMRNKLTIHLNDKVVESQTCNEDFLEFLSSFLTGRPFWLESG